MPLTTRTNDPPASNATLSGLLNVADVPIPSACPDDDLRPASVVTTPEATAIRRIILLFVSAYTEKRQIKKNDSKFIKHLLKTHMHTHAHTLLDEWDALKHTHTRTHTHQSGRV